MELGSPRNSYLILGVLASLVAGIAIAVTHSAGLDLDIATTSVLVPVTIAVFAICREHFNIGRITLKMIVVGVSFGIIYYEIFSLSTTNVRSSNGIIGYIFYFINVALVIPVFEELVVRRLLFFGLSKYVRPAFSALLVSAVFSMAHAGAMLWAFICSLLLCALAYRGIDTLNRSVVHGAFNASLGALWIWGASIHF